MSMPILPTLPPSADALRQLREQLGLSQSELAQALGFGANGARVVRGWEDGTFVPNPTSWKALRYLVLVTSVYRAMDPEQAATAVLGSMLPEAIR